MNRLAYVLAVLLLVSCQSPPKREMPPVPPTVMPSPLRRMVKVLPPPPKTVVITWSNGLASPDPGYTYFTSLECSADFAHWSEMGRFALVSWGKYSITRTNPASPEFYRVRNGMTQTK